MEYSDCWSEGTYLKKGRWFPGKEFSVLKQQVQLVGRRKRMIIQSDVSGKSYC